MQPSRNVILVRSLPQAGTPVLQRLVEAAQTFLGIPKGGVRAVTIQAGGEGADSPSVTHVWLVGPDAAILHHTLLHRREELSHLLGVDVVEVGVGECGGESDAPSTTAAHLESCEIGREARYSVVDAESTAVVGPRMRFGCGCRCGGRCERCATRPPPPVHTCTYRTCLNGGRCFPTSEGVRCACPLHTASPTCKVLMRHFQGDESIGSWTWVASIPPCPEVHISLEVLTTSQNATLLYSGPDHLGLAEPPPPGSSSREVLLLELRSGRPFLMLDLGGGPVTLALTASYSLADSTWHRLDVIWKDELVEMVVDLCSGGSIHGASMKVTDDPTTRPPPPVPPDAHTCRGAARLPPTARTLNYQRPLQVGGMAHPAPSHDTYGWPEPIRAYPLKGCVRNLRVNGEVGVFTFFFFFLGAGVLSSGSVPGCAAAECPANSPYCGSYGRCRVEAGAARCECDSGWTGADCSTRTTPSTFHLHSFVRLALSFSPLGYTTSISLRFRTRKADGDLVVLSSEGGGDRFGLQLSGGRACVLLQLHPAPPRTLCLAHVQLADGRWHRLHAARYGSATFLTADDGDGDLYNASVSLKGRQLLEVDREAGVVLGGASRQGDSGASASQRDFHEGCLDDVRISSRPVPLPPALNRTAWARVDEARGVGVDCEAPPACGNVTCRSPLTCVDTWRSYHCGCGEGRVMEEGSNLCQALDQCDHRPCLHGGTCLAANTGFTCSCLSGYGGRYCQLQGPGAASLKLSLAGLLAVLVWCTLLLLLVCAVLLHQHHRRSALRRGTGDGKESTTPAETKGHVSPSPSDCHAPYLLELRLLAPPRGNRPASWSTNPNIADVDVLQVDAASVTSSVEERTQQQQQQENPTHPTNRANPSQGSLSNPSSAVPAEEGEAAADKQEAERSGCDDLRNYAYEGGGSSPGSLSSCLESCSGNTKFLGGFREVAHMLES
ncbi:putative neural-cadherin 2 [Scylla paramamosain]|uniref:putative neural-cadherin 2 n=1 Tax=Scylla paramamosain TaxID=85552 RepID=UPI0030833E59